MENNIVDNVFESLRDRGDTSPLVHIIATGAGPELAQAAWDPPGASSYLTGVQLPYSQEETQSVLGFKPDKFVSPETAVDLAIAAYMKACRPGRKAVGLGMTCSVASMREHRGDHCIVIAILTDDGCHLVRSTLLKGTGTFLRRHDDIVAAGLAQGLLARVLQLKCSAMGLNAIEQGDDLAEQRLHAHPFFNHDGTRFNATRPNAEETILFPGAFNPPHQGHFGGGRAAEDTCALSCKERRNVVYALVTNPPHKPRLTVAQVLQRARLMKGHQLLVSRDDSLFIDKARRHPGAYIAMGADAMDRMLDPCWGPAIGPMLDEFVVLRTRFFVTPRLVDGELLTSGRVISRRGYDALRRSELFIPVNFRCDLSSTQLRERREPT